MSRGMSRGFDDPERRVAEFQLFLPFEVDIHRRNLVDLETVDRTVRRSRLDQELVLAVYCERNVVGLLDVVHPEHMVYVTVRIDGHNRFQSVVADVFRQCGVLLCIVVARIDNDAFAGLVRYDDRVLLERVERQYSDFYHISCVLFVRLHPLFAAKAAREFHTKIAITIFAGNNTQEKWQEKRQITRLSNRWRSFRWRLKGRRWDAITT